MSRRTWRLKQNPAPKPSSLRPNTALLLSRSHSPILSLCPHWAAKLSLSFTALPGWDENNGRTLFSPEYLLETQSGPLIPHILLLCFLSFFFSYTPFLSVLGGGGLKQACCKGKLRSVLSFIFFPTLFLLTSSPWAQTPTFHQKSATK